MAFEKAHIGQLQKEILLVEELGDESGYLNLIHMASAIFRVKCQNQGLSVLKNTLNEIIKDLDNENEDFYILTKETLNN
jgi:hypothetical protein